MANNPTATRPPRSAKNWWPWTLEQARRQGSSKCSSCAAPASPVPGPSQRASSAAASAGWGIRMISLPEGPFDLILADPGWRWNPWSWATGAGRSAERHYRTDPPESTKTIEVPAAKDCVLALWSISSMLPQALELMGAEFRVLQPGGLGEALDRTRVLVAPAAQAVAARNPRSHARPAARNQIPIRDLRPAAPAQREAGLT